MKTLQLKQDLETELFSFFANTKAKKTIIGISGGIDSAVTLAIAVNALGKENVFALLLPYKLGEVSSYANFEDAENLCKKLGIEYQKIELDNFVKPYLEIQSLDIPNSENLLILGNTLARIRMTLLFAHANKLNGIVLGTCNLTEILLGYETKFGDGAADVSVIGNLWKFEVYKLAKLYKLPKSFITKKPSAELYENQSDEDEMGFSYDEAEIILSALLNKNILPDKKQVLKKLNLILSNSGISKSIIEKIYNMHINSEHKRIPLPTLLS